MVKRLYPLPAYEGTDDKGNDVCCVVLAWYDDDFQGFPVEQTAADEDVVFRGSYEECCDYLEAHGC